MQFSYIIFDVEFLLIPKKNRRISRDGFGLLGTLYISYEELGNVVSKLSCEYNEFQNKGDINDPLYKEILYNFETIQEMIYYEFLIVANGFYEKKYQKIDLIEFELWLKNFIPFAALIEEIEARIPFHNNLLDIFMANHSDFYPRLNDDEIQLLKSFYSDFFKKFDDVRDESLELEDLIYKYHESKFNSILSSHLSRVFINITILIFVIFGLLVPIYMIQPLHFNWLLCTDVFKIIIMSFIFNILIISIAYLKRHKIQPTIKMDLAELGNSSSREQLPMNIHLYFRNISRIPVLSLIVSSNLYINNKVMFSKMEKIALEPYENEFIKLDFKQELENAKNSYEDILARDIKLVISYYYAKISFMNKIAISKVEQNKTYKWNVALTKWTIETKKE